MKTIVAFHSLYGNTKLVAEAVAEGLRSKAVVELSQLGQLKVADLEGVELLVVGTPTHNAGIPMDVRAIVRKWPKGCLTGMRVEAFDTSLKMNWFVDLFNPAAPKLAAELRRLGGTPLGQAQSFWVSGREGPLAEGELERAKAWGQALASAQPKPAKVK